MNSRGRTFVGWLIILSCVPTPALAAKLQPDTLSAWLEYKRLTEERIERELASTEGFLIFNFLLESDRVAIRSALDSSDTFIKKLKTRNEEGGDIKIPKGLVHHWYGIVLVRGAELEDVPRLVQDYDNHASYFEDVEDSRLVSHQGDEYEIFLRLRRKKVITVHYNTEHHVTYHRRAPGKVWSRSESTRIAELDNPGTTREREKPLENDRGFTWRLNSYWRFQQVPEASSSSASPSASAGRFPSPSAGSSNRSSTPSRGSLSNWRSARSRMRSTDRSGSDARDFRRGQTCRRVLECPLECRVSLAEDELKAQVTESKGPCHGTGFALHFE